MPSPRGRRPTKQAQDDTATRRWADAIAAGEDPDTLLTDIESTSSPQTARAVEGLGRVAGAAAVPVLLRLMRGSSAELAAAAAEALGATRDAGAAAALDAIARSTDDKQLQKAARRSLYRLGVQGIATLRRR